MTQVSENPFPYSDTNKRYHTYDYYLRTVFGGKVAKLPLDGGFTCPNLDGTCGSTGCIYCSERGSGDFAPAANLPIATQIRMQKERYAQKWDTSRCIAYFQARTNTYAPVEVLRKQFEEALSQDGIVGLNIATRPDCLPSPVLELLAELAEKTVLTVELGLQSSNDKTAKTIRRGHTFAQFCTGVEALKAVSSRIQIGAHVIFGLPGEGPTEMLQTVQDLIPLGIRQIKIHLLHVLRNTPLAALYEKGTYIPMSRTEYIQTVVKALEILPPETVIGRLTGDGAREALLAPLWSLKKTTVLNDIDKLLYRQNTYQGAKYRK